MRALLPPLLLAGYVLFAGCSDQSPLETHEPSVQAAHQIEADGKLNREIAEVREATAPFNDLDHARDEGYHLDDHCVSNPAGPGAMGYHAVNPGLVGDQEVDPLEPEVLVYAPGEDGDDLELVAVEYVAVAGPDHFEEAPSLFGETFVDHTENPHGIGPHYELHAWIWQHNPNGIFAQWNPHVSCPDHEE